MLIAGELDIELPEINFQDVYDFIERTRSIHHDNDKLCMEEKTYFLRNNKKYPWDRRILEFNGTKFFNYDSLPPFDKLTKIIDSLPIDSESRVVFLLSQIQQSDYDFNFHFDKDQEYGFRIAYGLNPNKPFLEFAKLKDSFIHLKTSLFRIEQHMMEDESFSLVPRVPNTVFCVTGNLPHRVPITHSANRFVVGVRGKLKNLDSLIFKSRIDI
jgi:hypothetical protein